MKVRKQFISFILLILAMLFALSACGPAATEETEEPPPNESLPGQEAIEEEISLPGGGTFVWALTQEPQTLDSSKAAMAVEDTVMQFTGGSLVWLAEGGVYVPYLAESWTTSEDGLVWEFKLREDVQFQDGNPLTAGDYVWTLNRAIDPDTGSPAAGPMLGPVASIEQVDDYSFRINLSQPNFPILYGLSDPGYLQPISKAAFEAMGEEAYTRDPVSVGPFCVNEWVTGTRILLERNPDYNWGPATLKNQGAYLLDFIEFRILPEYATIVAGMESGEIDYAYASFQQKDIDALKGTGMFDVFEAYQQGIRPYITLNVSKPPFDDLLVRKAINLGIDRQALLNVAEQGNGIVQYGPISLATVGYWEGVEQFGYGYDLEQAKTLMQEAGYILNEDGILEKDGQPLSLTYITTPDDRQVKVAQIVKEQLKELGVDLTIETTELGTLLAPLMSGDYQIGSLGMTFGEADLMHIMFHSSNVGAYNFSQLASPEMDEYLDATRNATDPSVRQDAVNNAQRYLIEQAIVVPLYTPVNFIPVNKRVKGAYYNDALITISLESAYIEE